VPYYFIKAFPVLPDELWLKQQVFWRVASYSQFRKSEQIDSQRLCPVDEFDYLPGITTEVTYSGINLGYPKPDVVQFVSSGYQLV